MHRKLKGIGPRGYNWLKSNDDAARRGIDRNVLTGINAEDLLNAPRKSAKLTGKTEVEIGGNTYTFKLKRRDGLGDGRRSDHRYVVLHPPRPHAPSHRPR